MNIEKLNEAVQMVKNSMGPSLLATEIFAVADGMSIAGINPQPIACALFNELTENMINALSESGFPSLKDYYLLSMENNHLVLIIYLQDYQWGILVDSTKVKLGLLLSIIMPKARAAFIDALES